MSGTGKIVSWDIYKCSEVGKRICNEDVVGHFTIEPDRGSGSIVCMIACDGVGGTPGGLQCSQRLYDSLSKRLKKIIRSNGRKIFYKRNTQIKFFFDSFRIRTQSSGETTMAVILVCLSRFTDGYRLLAFWAGDSRAHCIDHVGKYYRLTDDHCDEEGNITSFFSTKDGKFHGEITCSRFLFPRIPLVFGLTTDGFHNKCREDEFCRFLAWCLLEQPFTQEGFAELSGRFLHENISDNYSAVFCLRNRQLPREILNDILESPK